MATLDPVKLKEKQKRLIKVIGICTLFELFFAPFFAYLIHQGFSFFLRLEPGLKISIDTNYFRSFPMLFQNFGVRLWFIMIQVAYVFWISWLLIKPKAVISKVNEIKVTDKITIPVSVGNGQHGSARFTTQEEKDKIFETFIFSGTEKFKNQAGLVIEMVKKGGKEIIRHVKDDVHTLIIGASGAGKTRRILFQTVWLQMLAGVSIVISDVKGEIYYYTSKFAKLLKYKIVVIDFRNPKKSDHFNFLQPILDAVNENDNAKAIDATWDLVSVLVGEPKGEPLWYNGETATIAAAILALCLDAPEICRNMANVYYFLAYMCQPHPETDKVPLSFYLNTLPDDHPAKTVFAIAQVAPGRTKGSFFTSALGTLRLFTNPNVAEMSSMSDFNLGDIGKEKTIVYMIIPDENKKLYPLASILVQQIYMSLVEVANENGLTLPVETHFDLDEVGNFPTIPVMPEMVSAGRSRGIRLNMIIQAYQQLEEKYKNAFKTIKSNCRVKLFLKSDDPDTLKEISETLDSYTVEVTSASNSSNIGKSNDGSISTSSNMTGRKLLTPGELSRMDDPYGLCMVTGEYPSIVNLPDLSEYHLNEIFGLGSKEHNRKIVMEREAERVERKPGKIELWGIWNEYKAILEEDAKAQMKEISFLR